LKVQSGGGNQVMLFFYRSYLGTMAHKVVRPGTATAADFEHSCIVWNCGHKKAFDLLILNAIIKRLLTAQINAERL
jgi:hypothetical protein